MNPITDPALLEQLNGPAPVMPARQPGFTPTYSIGPRGLTVNVDPTKRQEEDKPLSPTDLGHFRDGNNKPPPPGASLRDVQQGGYRQVSTTEEALQMSQQGAHAVLGRLNDLVEKVFPEGDFVDRMKATPGLMASSITQDDPNVALYTGLSKGTLAPIIRSLGEKGTLAEGDVKRAIDMMPKLFPFPDSKEVARQKLQQIQDILSITAGQEPKPMKPSIPVNPKTNKAFGIGDLTQGRDGKTYVIKTLTKEGKPDDVELVR